MKWNYVAALATALAVMFIAGPAFADEGRDAQDEIVEDVVEANVTDADPWVIAPQPNEAKSDEEAPPKDEESGDETEGERPADDAERPTSDPPEDDTTIGVDDSDAKGEPLIAPAGDEEGDALWGGSKSYLYLAIPAITGVAVVGVVLHRRRN